MALISATKTIFDAGAMAAGFGGSMSFIKKLTASSSANLTFVNGASSVVLDSTFKTYLFTFKNIHPASDSVQFSVNFRDGGSSYDATKTTTVYRAYAAEGGASGYGYETGFDLAQSTSAQHLSMELGADNDQCCSGSMFLFNPSDTTFVKHFLSRFNTSQSGDLSMEHYVAGYNNVTAAIDAVQFSMSSGNIDAGDICLYGIA
tara:strand:- start:371 stop:979 length:609 start_codon:yes stop_codon:yes gene_type:complete